MKINIILWLYLIFKTFNPVVDYTECVRLEYNISFARTTNPITPTVFERKTGKKRDNRRM